MKQVFSVAALLLLCSAVFAHKVIIGNRESIPHGWELVEEVNNEHQRISFRIMLVQNNLDALNSIFERVSDPKSSEWGNFLTREQVEDLVRPDSEVFEDVQKWIRHHDKHASAKVDVYSDSIEVETTIKHAKKLFDADFFVFRNVENGKEVIRTHGEVSVPGKIARHIDFVAGLSELMGASPIEYELFPKIDGVAPRQLDEDIVITPSILKEYYNVPKDLKVENSDNIQGIAAFQDYFSFGALHLFESTENLPTANVTRMGPDCFPNCDQYESDLDVQYITAMATGANTIFINQAANYWILQFCEEVLSKIDPLPHVFSISYGWSELAQCQIAVANCPKLGYSSEKYVNRTNTDFQKLGTMGISIMVSDGDDGAPNLGGASGNCPMDPKIYCPTGGCQHTSSKCNTFQVLNKTSGEYCFIPMGIGSTSCSYFLNDPNANNAIAQFFEVNARCGLNLEQDYSQLPHVYSSCACSSIKKVESNGYVLSQYVFSQDNGAVFTADYPTSSPYVTSVGATQFIADGSGNIESEVVASILTHAIITTGGGFSTFQPQPSYQAAAVSAWVSNSSDSQPPNYTFDPTMRAYPDIAFNGHNYMVFYSNNTSDACPCPSTQVDGTSASSPAFSGLVTLINDQLISNGESPLGFLNPLLYQLAAEHPEAFNDITAGNNKCNRAYCCQYGYTAVAGWDPASGLGSPNFGNMLKLILAQKQQKTN